MINFIVCEDSKIILERNIDVINKVMFNNNIEYRIYKFQSYNEELKNIIKEPLENKIYILDIELGSDSGIDLAGDIRKIDLTSFIIISTVHSEYIPYTLKSKLLIFDYVSKLSNYNEDLSNAIKRILKELKSQKRIETTKKGVM